MCQKRLSILICSINRRKELFNRLMYRLTPQMDKHVEVLFETDDGQQTIGAKRNKLIRRSSGDYLAFVDDDDLVSFDYVSKILEAVESSPDCCGIEGIITFRGENDALFCHSIKYQNWSSKDGVYYRSPNHLNPVSRKIAKKVKFPFKNNREDRSYADAIYPFLKTEVYIEEPIYFYLCEKGSGLRSKGPYEKNKMTVNGDFDIRAKLSITNLNGSAAGVTIDDSVFGFEGGKSRSMFVEGDVFKGVSIKYPTIKYIREGRPFYFRIIRKGKDMSFHINNNHMLSVKYGKDKVNIAFRQMRSNMKVLKVDS